MPIVAWLLDALGEANVSRGTIGAWNTGVPITRAKRHRSARRDVTGQQATHTARTGLCVTFGATQAGQTVQTSHGAFKGPRQQAALKRGVMVGCATVGARQDLFRAFPVRPLTGRCNRRRRHPGGTEAITHPDEAAFAVGLLDEGVTLAGKCIRRFAFLGLAGLAGRISQGVSRIGCPGAGWPTSLSPDRSHRTTAGCPRSSIDLPLLACYTGKKATRNRRPPLHITATPLHKNHCIFIPGPA